MSNGGLTLREVLDLEPIERTQGLKDFMEGIREGVAERITVENSQIQAGYEARLDTEQENVIREAQDTIDKEFSELKIKIKESEKPQRLTKNVLGFKRSLTISLQRISLFGVVPNELLLDMATKFAEIEKLVQDKMENEL